MAKRKALNVDARIGERVRVARNMRGLTQEQLAEACGITFQQIQKYEKGSNRIGGSRFVQIAEALDVPVSYFFEGSEQGRGVPELPSKGVLELATMIESLEPKQEAAVRNLLKVFAE